MFKSPRWRKIRADLRVNKTRTALPEIAAVQVRRSYDARVEVSPGEFVNLQLFAVPDYEAQALNRIQPESGAWPPPDGEILIERLALDLAGRAEGDRLPVTLPNGTVIALPIAGQTLDLSVGAANIVNVVYGYVSMTTMEQITGESGFNQLDIRVAENADDVAYITQVANQVRDLLEQRGVIVFAAVVPPPGEPFSYVFIVALLLVLGVIGSLTFVLSGFLIINVMSALISQQTRQIGMMKAIGARGGQIVRLYLTLAAIFGVLALMIGLPLAWIGSRLLAGLIGGLNNTDITSTALPWWVFALQIVIGLIVPLLAALVPVLVGTRISVRRALDARGISARATLIDRLISRVRGIPRPILLSFRNTFRQRFRLALTLLTLTLAGAIFATVFTVRNSLYVTLDEALAYDDYDVAVNLGQAFPAPELIEQVSAIDGVTAVEVWAEVSGRYQADETTSAEVILRGVPPTSAMIEPQVLAGRWLEAGDINAIVLNGNLADAASAEVGDQIDLILRGQPVTWEVVGVVKAIYVLENIGYTSEAGLAAAIGEEGQARALRITTEASDQAFQNDVAAAITAQLSADGVLINSTQTTAALADDLSLRFNVLVGALLVLAGLLAIVGGLSIAGTTSLNVIERTREIGVMRSVGAGNGQILSIFVLEAAFVGALGWVFGSLLALPISRALSDGVGLAFSSSPLTYRFDLTGALLWLGLALALALISSFLPARRASRLTLREVLAYEG